MTDFPFVSYFKEHLVDLNKFPRESITDKYFTKSFNVINKTRPGVKLTYGLFIRRPMLMAIQPLIAVVEGYVPGATVTPLFEEGQYVPEETVFAIIECGSELIEGETPFLQVASLSGICAYNAYQTIKAYPNVPMLDMHARHGYSPQMSLLCTYGAAVATKKARLAFNGVGFVGTSYDKGAVFFNEFKGRGTMPHMLVGAFNGDLREAAKAYYEEFPNENLSVLVDYRGIEVDDTLRVANWFFNEAKLHEKGLSMSARLDTNGARFLQDLDWNSSVEVVCAHINAVNEWDCVRKVLGDETYDHFADDSLKDRVRRTLFGKGVTAAAIIHMRNELDHNGYSTLAGKKVSLVASSGFDQFKARVMANANAPIDMVGTGSYLPDTLKETYSTADVFAYDGVFNVKAGREDLYRPVFDKYCK